MIFFPKMPYRKLDIRICLEEILLQLTYLPEHQER
jgi:hypothetical protein